MSILSNVCPVCESIMNRVSNIESGKNDLPISGDLSICYTCCAPLKFTDDLKLRRMSESELLEAPDELFIARNALISVKNNRRK